eukprot:CAMPEP_0172489720 /NCGR_PEP_ID=MMETSP1066-20121228/19930_1 /TAXON_ID=671091 /ORGANISM="Coscinodiscus wailesii, Strain CCMP2513" /LENGTH=84 /DNA_ID=CAMNT_0013257797 /DNA_START=106 /DNA_END=360 /DNA_ORIENTATION=+
MKKQAGVPPPFKRTGSSVEAFGGFVKEHVTRGEYYVVGNSVEVFDGEWPGGRGGRVIDVEDGGDDVGGGAVQVHGEGGGVLVEA